MQTRGGGHEETDWSEKASQPPEGGRFHRGEFLHAKRKDLKWRIWQPRTSWTLSWALQAAKGGHTAGELEEEPSLQRSKVTGLGR